MGVSSTHMGVSSIRLGVSYTDPVVPNTHRGVSNAHLGISCTRPGVSDVRLPVNFWRVHQSVNFWLCCLRCSQRRRRHWPTPPTRLFDRVCLTLVWVCLTLAWVCPPLVRGCVTLIRVCPTLVWVCPTHVRVCPTLTRVSWSQVQSKAAATLAHDTNEALREWYNKPFRSRFEPFLAALSLRSDVIRSIKILSIMLRVIGSG